MENIKLLLPDLDDRSKNDPMVLLSSDDVLALMRGLQKPGERTLHKVEITEESLKAALTLMDLNGWKCSVTAGKQLLLSTEEIADKTSGRKNPHETLPTSRKQRMTYLPAGLRYDLFAALGLPDHKNLRIENIRLVGIFTNSDTP